MLILTIAQLNITLEFIYFFIFFIFFIFGYISACSQAFVFVRVTTGRLL